ncbi:MAG: class I SAM-dependent methyltransferase [Pseudomonadota bacterium]
MGLATLAGRPRGFFSPYRHAAEVAAPAGYPALEPLFAAAFAAPASGTGTGTGTGTETGTETGTGRETETGIGTGTVTGTGSGRGTAAGTETGIGTGTAGMACPADVIAALARYATALAGFAGPAPQPRWDQTWYPRLDGAAAYAILRAAPPRRVIEVGSGHSTRFMARALADAGAAGPADAPTITCIDPAPRAALDGLPVRWERRLLAPGDAAAFAALEPGDVAFFDSAHLLWPGSDVDLILNGILPVLAPGVLVHLHDIFLPDPYPEAWAWRGYTEQLGLSGWLAGGARILWSSRYAVTRAGVGAHQAVAGLPLVEDAPESALWMIMGRSG